jgi:hypothetical protein
MHFAQGFPGGVQNPYRDFGYKKNYKIKMCIKEVQRFTLKYAHIYDARVPGKVLAAIVAHFKSNRFDAWQ